MAPTLRSMTKRPRREDPPEYRPRNPIEALDMRGELPDSEEEETSDGEEESERENEEEETRDGEEETERENEEEEEEGEQDTENGPLPAVNRGIIVPEELSIIAGQNPTSGSDDPRVYVTNPSVFDCPVCYDTLSIPIYQCVNGHIVCSPCFSKIQNNCPFCSRVMGEHRCRSLEAVLESLKATCCNAKFGCRAKILYCEKREHEKECSYLQFRCPIPECTCLSNFCHLPDHLRLRHSHTIKSFQYGKFFNVILRRNKQFVVLQASSDKKLFVVDSHIALFGNIVSLRHIGAKMLRPQEFLYEVIKMKTKEALLLETSVMTADEQKPLGNTNATLSSPTFYVPLEKFSRAGDCYIVRFKIAPNPDFDAAAAATFSGEGPSTSSRIYL